MAGEFCSPIRLFVSEEEEPAELGGLGNNSAGEVREPVVGRSQSCAGRKTGVRKDAVHGLSEPSDTPRSEEKHRGIVEYTPDMFEGRKGHLSSSEVFLKPKQQIMPEKSPETEPEVPEKTRKKQVKVQVVEQEKPQQRVVEQSQCENNNIIYAQYSRPVEMTSPVDVITRLFEIDFWVDLVFFMCEVVMPVGEISCQECQEPDCAESLCEKSKKFRELMCEYFQAELSGESNINIINFMRDKCPGASRSIKILNNLNTCELLENTLAHRAIYSAVLDNINIYILNIADGMLGSSKSFCIAKNFLLQPEFFLLILAESNKLSGYFEKSEYISKYDCRDFYQMATASKLFSERFCK